LAKFEDPELERRKEEKPRPVLKPRAEYGQRSPTIRRGTYQQAAHFRAYAEKQAANAPTQQKNSEPPKDKSIFHESRRGEMQKTFNKQAERPQNTRSEFNQNAARISLADRAAKLKERTSDKGRTEISQMQERDRSSREKERDRDHNR